ncbi:dol-P-Man:Man(7)GlcNAc(2)-PP-Dol alpha-1,6-mannosyltransferase-like [Zerene cesonia]|uniref:dol-P-Man:Man(7)GlcNAc(2)-PP-Dol alpha-1,6-mannosyltransferase-like n=1 Tax=Zerene cesonia TaxID=33412 RepID=UPI0018E5783A|nr:dol-P-Man:Man(7)GlcNAc(2)-PP-Dol alpha-1,6-mannosyltransferase-like [Zerene cesonia]
MVQLLYIVSSLHVLLCPFTKVEESFNIQAFHDILYHRFNLSEYDHNEFPGVVPRTFIGPLVISTLSSPVVLFLHLFGINKFWTQYVVRLTLALTVIAAWSRLRNTLQKLYGNTFAWWFTTITASQYHFMFYMSRPLPNIMALPLVLLAFDGWLSGKYKQFIISAGAAIVIFRSELAMLFGVFLLIDLYFKKITIFEFMKIVAPAGAGLVLLTVVIDSIFWGRLVWPEAEVFWFNTVLNKSSDWGTSPFLWYFYSALPRGLGPSIILIPVGLYLDKRVIPIAVSTFVYILLFSFLPHKELRFIIYVFPLLNVSSAITCSYVYIRRTKSPIYELLFWGLMIIIICNIVFTATLVLVAMTNYPGGVGITRFHKLLKNEPYVHVHVSNLAAQTGVTRFTQIHDHWTYSKNESLTPEELQGYTHLLVEAKSKYSPSVKAFAHSHTVLDSIDSFSQIAMNYRLIPPIKIKTKPALFILERNNFRQDLRPYLSPKIYKDSEEISSSEIDTKEIEINLINYDESVQSEEQLNDDNTLVTAEKTENTMTENVSNENTVAFVDDEETELFRKEIEESIFKTDKPNKEFNEHAVLNRSERKKKAIEKIKSETRKEVVASAKEKLKEIMRRHKHVAKEISENDLSKTEAQKIEEDGRGDIPDIQFKNKIIDEDTTNNEQLLEDANIVETTVDNTDDFVKSLEEAFNVDKTEISPDKTVLTNEDSNKKSRTNQNIDSIVEEVIARLIDRKIYDDKTKPEDIKIEDRKVIQKIVEEILSERMNFTNTIDNSTL